MLGKVETGVMYSNPRTYCVIVISDNMKHDAKYVECIGVNHNYYDIMKIHHVLPQRGQIVLWFYNEKNAEDCASIISKCHLYDNSLRFY